MAKTNTLHARLQGIAGDMTFAALGDLTGTHPETVRRYMRGQNPSADFLAALCQKTGVNGDWLLIGRGQQFTGKPARGVTAGGAGGKKAGKKGAKRRGRPRKA